MKLKNIGIYLIAIIAAVSFIGCSSDKGRDKNSGENTKVRVGFFPNITHSQALVGKNQGQFQKSLGDKYPIEWKQFNAGPAEIEALLAGELDMGYIGPGPAINGYTKSKGEIQIIGGASDAGAVLVARKDADIKEVKDLQGKKVAIPQFGNTQDLSLRALLKENGLKDKTKGGTVEIVQAENPDIKTLLDQSRIDAALVPEPWGSRLEKEVGAKLVLDYNKVWREGQYSTAVIVARKDFIKKHPEVVEKFLKAHIDITDYINKDNEGAKSAINDELGKLTKKPLPNEVLDSSFKRVVVTNNPEKKSIEEMVDLSVDVGFLREKPDLKNLFSLDILNKVLKEKGKQEIK